MKTLAAIAVAAAILGTSLPAAADGVLTANYGGQITETADGWRIEFAVRDGGIRAWVRDHGDKPVTAAGKATLLVNGKKQDVPLKADGVMLTGDTSVTPADKVATILSLSVNGKAVSARFSQDAVVTPPLSARAGAGKAAFEQVCAACHGTALRGSDAAPPLLHAFYQLGSGHGDDVILAAATSGAKSHMWKFGDMPKPEGLKPGQEKDVLAYIRAMQAANGFAGTAVKPADQGAMPMDHSGHMKH
ncbi:cytochrome c [Magnetospirillum sp. 64-120]|uniref:cytochrome c n=1 Tax=Magnetospirillum sp. 64-120 TaxID=1895778 RepID=UPI0025BC4054|nr:cytochrome c [Magnetospirillum sp. 64-120]